MCNKIVTIFNQEPILFEKTTAISPLKEKGWNDVDSHFLQIGHYQTGWGNGVTERCLAFLHINQPISYNLFHTVTVLTFICCLLGEYVSPEQVFQQNKSQFNLSRITLTTTGFPVSSYYIAPPKGGKGYVFRIVSL